MRYAPILFSLSVSILTACTPLSTRPSVDPGKVLIKVSCPDLTELQQKDFGSVDLKLIEVAGQYHKCREAALGSEEEE